MKKRLRKILDQRNARKAEINKLADASTDVEELRGFTTELDTINKEIRDLEGILEGMKDPEEPQVVERTAAVNGQVPGIVEVSAKGQEKRNEDDVEELEYRKAFQQFVTRGIPIPAELRADANTLTSDISAAIPTITVNRIVEKLESTGMIMPMITRTSFTAGMEIPTSSVKPVATWVSEGESSDKQKKTAGKITFTNFKLRCEISMSVESSTMAIAAFEASFERQVTEAMLKAIEQSIITGAGTGSPKGILLETPATGQTILADTPSYKVLIDAEAALPQAYENGAKWCMTKKTFMQFVGITDTAGQPIARVNYGVSGKPERFLLGREVVLCGDYMTSWSASIGQNEVYAFLFNFADYALNTIYNMGIQRKQDWDTEDYLTKAVMSVDGKVIDKNSLVVVSTDAEV
ncbi:phage major capsid protein [Eubacteriaceae bacterium ES2]|nr:phage major capsid protein [Eubacteriaceae bacterium ES2]